MEQLLLNKLIKVSALPCQIIHQYLHKSSTYSNCKYCNKKVCKQCSKFFKNCDKYACASDCFSCYKKKHIKCDIYDCSFDSCMALCKFCFRYFCNKHGDKCRKCDSNTCYKCNKICIDRIINDYF